MDRIFGQEGKAVLVTGGGRGIGRTIAVAFASVGARVAVSGRSEKELEATAEEIGRAGGEALAFKADVRDAIDSNRLVAKVAGAFGRIDVLVNNAGCWAMKPLGRTTDEDWDLLIDTNLKGPFLLSRAAVPFMTEAGGGRIINIASLNGLVADADLSAYCASKFGLIGLTRALAAELKPVGITVNAVCPGAVSVGRGPSQRDAGHWPAAGKQGSRIGGELLPRHVAAACLFLASDGASQVTGSAIEVPGGTDVVVRVGNY